MIKFFTQEMNSMIKRVQQFSCNESKSSHFYIHKTYRTDDKTEKLEDSEEGRTILDFKEFRVIHHILKFSTIRRYMKTWERLWF